MIVVLSLGILYLGDRKESACRQSDRFAHHISSRLSCCQGFLFAIEQMPVALQWITRILPARYYVSVLKKIFLKGTPTAMLYCRSDSTGCLSHPADTVATRSFHKRLE
jgi:ABC-2 type transport system permease protein